MECSVLYTLYIILWMFGFNPNEMDEEKCPVSIVSFVSMWVESAKCAKSAMQIFIKTDRTDNTDMQKITLHFLHYLHY